MADLKEVEQTLNTYIRPLTFPLAIKMLKSEKEIPEKTRRPFQQMKKKVAICQGIGMARKLGWAVAMGKEDMQCALGAAPFGFLKILNFLMKATLPRACLPLRRRSEKGKKISSIVLNTALQSYLVAPLNRAAFEPDLFMMYGNPAQIMRLIQGALYSEGGRFLLHPWEGWDAQRLLR